MADTVRVAASIFDCSLLRSVRSRACSQGKEMIWRTTAKSGSDVFDPGPQVSDSFVCYACNFVLISRTHYNLKPFPLFVFGDFICTGQICWGTRVKWQKNLV